MARRRKGDQRAQKSVVEAPREPDDADTAGGGASAVASSSQQSAAPDASSGASSQVLAVSIIRKPIPTLSGLPVELKQLILDELVSSVRESEDSDEEENSNTGEVEYDEEEAVYYGSGCIKSVRRLLADLSLVNSEWNALCSRHFWDEVALSRASLAALRYFVLEILPRHADSIRCLDMRLTACEHPNGVQDDLGKACTMTVGQAERRHGGTARNLRLYVGASVEEKLATMHGQRQVERVGLKAGYKCNGRRAPVKYRQAAAEASVQVKKQLERGERHNMFLEILKTVPQVEQVVMDIVPFALDDDAARHAGVAGELHDVLTDKAETLRSLEIRIKAPASFGREHLAETLRPLRHLEILTVFGQRSSGTDEDAPSDAQTTSSSRATLGEIISAMTDLVALELRDYDIIDDSWAHLTRSPILVWPLTALALVNVSHCTFDVIHAIIKGCSDTLQDLELKKTPPAPAAVEGAHGRNVGPAFNDSTAQIQTSDDVEFLSPANRSLATPLPACNDLDRLVIATDFHGSYLKLFEHCKSIKRLELEDCPRLAPGDVLAFLRVHPQVDDLDVTHGCNFYDMVGWHAVVDYCQREREILIHDISDFLSDDEDESE